MNKIKMIYACLAVCFLTSCGPSTKIVKSWMEPGATVSASQPNKTLIVAMVKDEVSRRVIEDELAKRFKSKAVASYTILTAESIKSDNNGEIINQKLKDGQFTHVLLMRLADVEKDTYYVQGTTTAYYGGYRGYYGYGGAMYSDPGYYTTDKNYFVETTVYSVPNDKLLWTGTTKTVNPEKITKTVNEIADAVYYKMKDDGFLVK